MAIAGRLEDPGCGRHGDAGSGLSQSCCLKSHYLMRIGWTGAEEQGWEQVLVRTTCWK